MIDCIRRVCLFITVIAIILAGCGALQFTREIAVGIYKYAISTEQKF